MNEKKLKELKKISILHDTYNTHEHKKCDYICDICQRIIFPPQTNYISLHSSPTSLDYILRDYHNKLRGDINAVLEINKDIVKVFKYNFVFKYVKIPLRKFAFNEQGLPSLYITDFDNTIIVIKFYERFMADPDILNVGVLDVDHSEKDAKPCTIKEYLDKLIK